jgi:uncharacterized protein (TIRG00374 family)
MGRQSMGSGTTEPGVVLPAELDLAQLRRRVLEAVALLAALVLVALLAPGLGQVRHHLARAAPGWLAAGVLLEVLSCLSYVLMFRPVFCPQMSRRTTAELALSELGVGSIVPAAGAGGLALGVWALRRSGLSPNRIATRTVAFFLIKGMANWVAVAVVGLVAAAGLARPHLSLALTLVPAAIAIAGIALVFSLPWLSRRWAPRTHAPGAGRARRAVTQLLVSLPEGVREGGRILRSGNLAVILGSLGYWAFDNAVLWACFKALGYHVPLVVLLLGYLIGQLGGILPLPGGVGGVDGGLIGALVVYGTPFAAATAAVLVYRLILFWVPLILAVPAFVGLRRGLNRPDRPDLCVDPVAATAALTH